MIYEPITRSAIAFAQAGKLEEWLHRFLCNEGDNRAFSEGLKLEPRVYYPPRMMPLGLFRRCCGPEEGMKWQIDAAGFEKRVKAIMKKYRKGKWDMPPLIVNFVGDRFELNDGNHRHEALKRLGISEYWVIIWETAP